MNDDAASKNASQKSWLEQISHLLSREPQDRAQLIDLLREAKQRNILDTDALEMIEGVFQISDMQVRDIMIPRSHMVVVEEEDKPDEFLPKIVNSSHSRFPIIRENRDEVIGIILAKDLLKFNFNNGDKATFNIQNIMRPAIFVPESKRIDVLLKEFRLNHNHMAIVVDEYGGVAGLVTIEDILEEIVGEIEDEFDTEEIEFIHKASEKCYTINGLTPIEDFNEHFHCHFSDEEFDTIGGYITHQLGHLPRAGEAVTLDEYQFKVLNADKRRIRQIELVLLG